MIVRVAASLLRDLDWQLGEHAHAFLERDLTVVVEKIARDWDDLPRLFPGRDDYRLWIGWCSTGPASVEAQTAADGAVELVSITLDFEGLG